MAPVQMSGMVLNVRLGLAGSLSVAEAALLTQVP